MYQTLNSEDSYEHTFLIFAAYFYAVIQKLKKYCAFHIKAFQFSNKKLVFKMFCCQIFNFSQTQD